jgi:hypothetical protein
MTEDFKKWYKQTKELSLQNTAYCIGKVTNNYRTFKQYFNEGLTPEQALKKYFL